MNAIRRAGSLLVGVALMAGCTERNAPTALRNHPGIAFGAAALTSTITDPVGDVKDGVPGWQDIVGASVAKQGQNLVFTMDLAAPVPDNPPLPSWADLMLWHFSLDTDPTAFPVGYPFTKNSAGWQDVMVDHRVYRSGFTDPYDPTSGGDILVDRRPLLTGGQVIITPIQLTIEGAKLTWVVDAALLPSTFQWAVGTVAAHAGGDVKNGYNNILVPDVAPDIFSGAPLATWPQ